MLGAGMKKRKDRVHTYARGDVKMQVTLPPAPTLTCQIYLGDGAVALHTDLPEVGGHGELSIQVMARDRGKNLFARMTSEFPAWLTPRQRSWLSGEMTTMGAVMSKKYDDESELAAQLADKFGEILEGLRDLALS